VGTTVFFKHITAVLIDNICYLKTVVKYNLNILPLWGRQLQDIFAAVFSVWGTTVFFSCL